MPSLQSSMQVDSKIMMSVPQNVMDTGSSSDAFDGSAEPIVYMSENRMPVMIEFNSTIIYVLFAALILALLFILPGVRKTKLTSFLGLVTLLSVGASILLAIEGSHWLTGTIQLNEIPYGVLTPETLTGQLNVNIGLQSANVTLVGNLSIQESKPVNYNERFHWDSPDRMTREHIQALKRGLPYPILTVTEFLSQDIEGFNWGRQLRQAGYYSSMALYVALASWCLTAVIMCLLPVYLPHMMNITGAFIIFAVWIYTSLLQPKGFQVQLGGKAIEFAYGYTVVSTFAAGALSMFAGLLLLALQMSNPLQQCTIMDSEQFVSDRKQLYQSNLVAHHQIMCNKPQTVSSKDMAKNSGSNVVIPMGDIEQNFTQASKEQN